MLIGYVSDEMHVAIADAQLEFQRGDESIEIRSRASGAVVGHVPAGRWRVSLAKPGYTRKYVDIDIAPDSDPYRFRLLSDRLLGYMWPKWVRGGDSAELRIHSPESFNLSLWRYGWGKEQVADLGLFESFGPGGDRQILPDGDFASKGCDWNHNGYPFGPDARNIIEAPERSGLYYLHMKGRSGAFFSFPWIVAPKEPTSDIAVLASNIDWNAYNDFGGRSNYVAAQFLPIEPAVNVRQHSPYLRDTGGRFWDRDEYDPISFDRPEPVNRVDEDEQIDSPMRRIGSEHVAPATWRLLGWMEREGIAHDLYAETQLQSGALDLDRYKLVILDQHPEYWSRKMYEQLKTWVFERGGTLMYLGGNGLDCEVEFVHDNTAAIHRNGDRKYWIEIRDFVGGPGSFPPGRMEITNECPAHLTGVHTTMTGMGTAAPFKVHAADHWAFEGTGLREGDLFGHTTLDVRNPGGASGHETDKMCEHSPAGTLLLAKGINEYEGGSDLVAFETPSGGQVFSTGSICWICSLPVDDQVSRVTANVIRRFTAGHGSTAAEPSEPAAAKAAEPAEGAPSGAPDAAAAGEGATRAEPADAEPRIEPAGATEPMAGEPAPTDPTAVAEPAGEEPNTAAEAAAVSDPAATPEPAATAPAAPEPTVEPSGPAAANDGQTWAPASRSVLGWTTTDPASSEPASSEPTAEPTTDEPEAEAPDAAAAEATADEWTDEPTPETPATADVASLAYETDASPEPAAPDATEPAPASTGDPAAAEPAAGEAFDQLVAAQARAATDGWPATEPASEPTTQSWPATEPVTDAWPAADHLPTLGAAAPANAPAADPPAADPPTPVDPPPPAPEHERQPWYTRWSPIHHVTPPSDDAATTGGDAHEPTGDRSEETNA